MRDAVVGSIEAANILQTGIEQIAVSVPRFQGMVLLPFISRTLALPIMPRMFISSDKVEVEK